MLMVVIKVRIDGNVDDNQNGNDVVNDDDDDEH